MRKLGFNLARTKTITALLSGPQYIIIERREAQGRKNLLASGEVTPEDVVTLLRCCRGARDQYRETPHHRDPEIPVHEFKPVRHGVRWYIKVYFFEGTRELEPAIFISVHTSDS
jgi:hypothetical protein